VARSNLLLLLNSDVLPARPGWIGQMAQFYRSTPLCGALGVKLLYEDDSLQHAGMYFARVPGTEEYENLHYYKGLHRTFAAANVARQVPAITGACLMVAADIYRQLDGLHGGYVNGDFEDSDFCLRLHAEGLQNWYLPSVELYHLEGQSYPARLRQQAYRYNRWLHTHLHGAIIEQVMRQSRALPTGGT
jgi:O-antigen biosynthesis protein